MLYAKQSTAIIVTVGPVLDASGVAVTTSVVGDFLISKNGAAPAALNGSATLTHRNTGNYSLSLTATDVNTVGTVEIVINATTNACPIKEVQVVETTIYDALFADTANGFSGAAGASTVTFANTSIATVTTVTNQLTAAAIATGVWQDATAGDFTVASSIGKTLYIANVAPGGSGGLLISGSNAGTTTLAALTVTGATTCTGNVSMAAGLNITQSSANTSALVVTGNGTGHGGIFTSGSGATGDGLRAAAASTNGNGFNLVGVGTGSGLLATGGATGHGLKAVGGATSGDGFNLSAATSGIGLSAAGAGTTKAGALFTGGTTTSAGLSLVGGGTSGDGLLVATTSGHGLNVTATGASKHGVTITGGDSGTSDGLKLTAGTGGVGFRLDTLTASGAWNLGSTLTVTGTTSLAALTTSGTATLNALTVSNATTLTGAVSLGSTLATTGTVTFNAFTVTNALTVSGATTLTGAVAASNASNNIVGIDVAKISGDATAADNAELFFDGTGYNASTSAIGTVATATAVTTVNGLAAGVITAASIAADAITAAKVADGTIDAATFAASAITATVLAADCITAAKIADGAIDANTFAAGAITAAAVADGAIDRATFAADTGLQTVRSNTAQAGAATTITLDASASATNDFYNQCRVYLTGGTGAGQSRKILDYVGATKVATVRAWATNPDNTSTFAVVPEDSVWDDITADHLTSGSTGAALNAAGSAGDPWSTAVPGAYGAGTAGFILGTNLDATVSSRGTLTQTQVTGGAYALNSASFAFNAALDFTTTQKAATLARVTLTDTATAATLANGAHGGTAATLRLGGSTSTPAFYVTNSGGDAVQFESTGGNGLGLDLLGNGTGAGQRATGGATGSGFAVVGGATSGHGLTASTTDGVALVLAANGAARPGIAVSTSDGHGVDIAATGTSRHGMLITGGTAGTSDGFKAAAGSGGVDIRGNITGNLVGTVSTLTTYTGNTVQTGDSFARLGAPAGASVSADVAAVKTDTGNLVARITSTLFSGITSLAEWLGLIAGKQTGNSTARTEVRATGAGSGTYDETTDSQEAIRDNTGTAGAGLTAADDAVITAIGALNNITAASVWAVGTRTLTAGTNIDGSTFTAVPWNSGWDAEVQSEVDDALKATLAEGYRSTGAVGSVRDLLYEVIAHLGESSISGTTKTLKKLDASTTAKVYTLNSATTPTSITETS